MCYAGKRNRVDAGMGALMIFLREQGVYSVSGHFVRTSEQPGDGAHFSGKVIA